MLISSKSDTEGGELEDGPSQAIISLESSAAATMEPLGPSPTRTGVMHLPLAELEGLSLEPLIQLLNTLHCVPSGACAIEAVQALFRVSESC